MKVLASYVVVLALSLFTAPVHAATTFETTYDVHHNHIDAESGHGHGSTNEETGKMNAWLMGDSSDEGVDDSWANQYLGGKFDATGGQAYTIKTEGDFKVEMGTVGTADSRFWLSVNVYNEDTEEKSSWDIKKLTDANDEYIDDYNKSFTWEPEEGGEFRVTVNTWAEAIAYGELGSASVDYSYDGRYHYVDYIKISKFAGDDFTNRWGPGISGNIAVAPGIETLAFQLYQTSVVLKSVNGFADTIAIDVEEECDWLSVWSTTDQVTLAPGQEKTVELLVEVGDIPSSFWIAPVTVRMTPSIGEPRESSFFIQGIPEPSTFVLLTMGAVGLLACGRQRRH